MNRTLVVGDIHGHLTALEAILQAVQLARTDTLIALGDYIDRGPDSRGVLDRMIALQSECQLIPLLGNHEEMMLASRIRGRHGNAEWLANGGDKTLESYGGPLHSATGFLATLDDVPPEHWLFLNNACRQYHETETHLFVHACALSNLAMDQQPKHVLRWERFDDPPRHISGKMLVCGHTPQRSGNPRYIGHAVCLDTGIHAGRVLTCWEIETGQIWQANEKGKMRESKLEDHRI
jgi:serine/threonine protein phosphatase 1